MNYLEASAQISDCGRYRYLLTRVWDPDRPLMGACLLNPSTADGTQDDPTLRKLVGFAARWGHGGLLLGNCYAWRATDPLDLKREARRYTDLWGENDLYLEEVARRCRTILVGWGNNVLTSYDERRAVRILEQCPNLVCLSMTKKGRPQHPLYIRYEAHPQPYRRAA
jgi:hypothetical protein